MKTLFSMAFATLGSKLWFLLSTGTVAVLVALEVAAQVPERAKVVIENEAELVPSSELEVPAKPLSYLADIQPILSNKCYACHGPDESTRQGGVRFDQQESAFGEGDSGERPIVPGDPDQSELLVRIHASDDSQMPPADQELQLTDQDRVLLRQWIASGADWQSHWAFVAPVTPEIPTADADQDWPRNAIDHFVQQKLAAQGMAPAPMADRRTLIRRLSFDLTGLPPTPPEIEAFVNDTAEDAYEKIVNRLLSSPHYGEHMAVDWLDAARFADTNGYQNDFGRKMWPWRDWVIAAFNNNQPYDQFTIEQIAGDMLPDATLEQKIASGFNRNNRSVTEAGSIEEEWLVENIIDRVETTSTVFLGLTMGCARCHDHKFDPISQREFFEFFAYFNSTKDKGVYVEERGNVGPVVTLTSPEFLAKVSTLKQQIEQNQTKLKDLEPTQVARQATWEDEFANKKITRCDDYVGGLLTGGEPRPVSLGQRIDELGDTFFSGSTPFVRGGQPLSSAQIRNRETSYLDLGQHFEFDGEQPFSIAVWAKPKQFGAILSRMDGNDSYRGFDLLLTPEGRLNVHLIHRWPENAIKITTKNQISKREWSHVSVTYDGSQKVSGLKVYFDSKPIEFDIDVDQLSGSILTEHPLWLGFRAGTVPYFGDISDVRFYDRVLDSRELDSLYEASIQSAITIPTEQRSKNEAEFVKKKFRLTFSEEEAVLNSQRTELQQSLEALLKQTTTSMVMEESDEPRKTYVLLRGLYDHPDTSQELQPGIPAFLPQPTEVPKNRLGLARWIVDPQNPLTARVAVNRFWQHFFGAGLVDSPDNLGVQSPLPIYRELLDWLATEFVRSGWDVKAMQKMIVMSATYQQSSAVNPETLADDSMNRWLGRGTRLRLSSESVRDNALAISGLLTRRIGGESFKPYQPQGLWEELAGGASEGPYKIETDDNLYRRSLYIYRKRTVPHPTMATFDAGSRETCSVARQRTNTPLQALALLNDETYVEAARSLAIQCLKSSSQPEQFLKDAFVRATGRNPQTEELKILHQAYQRYQTRYADHPESAKEFLSFGQLPVPANLDQVQVAAMTAVCSTILNLDETITKE